MSSVRVPLVLAVALAGSLAGCASDGGSGGGSGGAASCAAVVDHDGVTYSGTGELVRDPAVTGRSLKAVLPACNDTGDNGVTASEPDEAITVEELADVPAETAVLFQGSVYVRDGSTLPRSVDQAFFTPPRCDSEGGFELTGDWLGVTGPHEPRSDGDLRLPYRLRVHVTSGPAAYVGATVEVHATEDTAPALGPSDVKQSLWQGGEVTATVACVGGRFEALGLHT